jgi:hypothetical protein
MLAQCLCAEGKLSDGFALFAQAKTHAQASGQLDVVRAVDSVLSQMSGLSF